jgi:tRNA A37 threonylcarbamoyladenosine dehydratase
VNKFCFSPTIMRLNQRQELAQFQNLVYQGVKIIDFLQCQLNDIVRIKNPGRKLSGRELSHLTFEHIGTVDWVNYGCWVYYPWNNTIVHTLDKDEFAVVRTIRNQYKLTPTEQNKLSNKRVGIIGMSVGHSVAMALAIERVCCEIRIADFDNLELSNMNRIRTSILNIGLPKTVIVAREIAEMDPFIQVRCFENGIDERNIESFFEEYGKLDVLIEECDSVDMKILARQIARIKGVPVVMDTSDRGMIDVERFDLDNEYPILHGLIDSTLDYNFLKNLRSSKEKLPYILPFAGLENISDRLAISAMEIESSITSWPQLGTEVQIGGALAAQATRSILLRKDHLSKRIYHETSDIEIDRFVLNQEAELDKPRFDIPESYINHSYKSDVCSCIIQEVLSEALAAPSASNLQPWNYLLKQNNYFICSEKVVEESNRKEEILLSILGIGTLLESIELLCSRRNVVFFYELLESCSEVIWIRMKFERSVTKREYDTLANYLKERCTDRSKFKGSIISSSEMLRIHDLLFSEKDLVKTHVFHQEDQMKEIIEIIGMSDKFRLLSCIGHDYFFRKEIKFENQINSSTGIQLSNLMLDKSEEIGLRILARENVRAALHEQKMGGNIATMSNSYSYFNNCIVIFTVANGNLDSLLSAGRQIQRFWLAITAMGLSVHPMTSPIPIIYSSYSKTKSISPHDSIIVDSISKRLDVLLKDKQIPVFICRLFRNVGTNLEKSSRVNFKDKFHSL